MEVLAIIPARSGSKGIPDKNIRNCNGKPLLGYSIEHTKKARTVNRVIVSTDSVHYAEIAGKFGAETPFLRPAELSGNHSLDVEVFEYALCFLSDTENYKPDICVHLRPTHPVREARAIDDMVQTLILHPEWDSIRSVSPAAETSYKMWNLETNGLLTAVADCDIPEAYNAPRQILPKVYLQNACIDAVRSEVILTQHSMSGKRIGAYVQNIDFDIDSESDFFGAELYLEIKEKLNAGSKLTVCIDIGGVIAEKNRENNYAIAKPIRSSIQTVNRLYDDGHRIILFTARGSATNTDWMSLTQKQLSDWGVRYTELRFGKPAADIYIDDRLIDINRLHEFFE
jgi:CMP-N-acetylneuraminic acid synthetase